MQEENRQDYILDKNIGLKPKLITEQISKALTNEIMDGRLKCGQKLVEAVLQKQFGTSKSPIREALRDLEKKGLVVISPRRGAKVKEITNKDIEEIFPIRSALEGLAAKEAYKKMTKEDIKKLESIFIEMKNAIKNNDLKLYRDRHFKFHQIFIDASDNRLLIDLLKKIRENILWYSFSYKYFKEDYNYNIKIHNKILNLYKNKDGNGLDIENLVRQNIIDGYKKFKEYLEGVQQNTSTISE